MCGRFTLTRSPSEIVEHFGFPAEDAALLAPRYNVAPSQPVAVVLREGSERRLRLHRWGLIPPWAKDPGLGLQTINARIESADARPAYRDAFAHRRCLVPADGFYEWSGGVRARAPHHVRLPGGALFAMAGLHERFEAPDGTLVASCSILTCEAHPAVRGLHDRMPVLVDPRRYDAWLDPALVEPEAVRALVDDALASRFEIREVDARVNSPRVDDPACLAPPAQLRLL